VLLGRNKLYILLTITCIAGCSWLYFSSNSTHFNNNEETVCLFKNVSGTPCPSCGSTRSVLAILKGNYLTALQLNPFGFIVGFILLITPPWLLTDVILNKSTLFEIYKKIEIALQKPQFYVPLIIIVLTNWIWNIYKGL
jgi:hypothetical protein